MSSAIIEVGSAIFLWINYKKIKVTKTDLSHLFKKLHSSHTMNSTALNSLIDLRPGRKNRIRENRNSEQEIKKLESSFLSLLFRMQVAVFHIHWSTLRMTYAFLGVGYL